MAISLKHSTLAVGAEAGNGEIGKTQWNEDHALTMGTGKLLGRSTAGDGAVEEITLGAGLALAAGELTASGAVGGSNTQVQFNDGGAFGGDAGLTFNKTSKALTLGGATVTTSSPVIDAAQTWNAGGVTFTGLKFNATDTASAAGSLLMDLQVGGTSQLKVDKAGSVTLGRYAYFNKTTNYYIEQTSNQWNVWSGGTNISRLEGSSAPQYRFVDGTLIGWGLSAFNLVLRRRAAANLQLGEADAAAPVAQTLSVQSVVAGTTNTAGANLTITGSQGTGTGAGGSIIFQVAPAGSTGTAQNALATALTINPSGTVSLGFNGSSANPSIGRGNSGFYFSAAGGEIYITNAGTYLGSFTAIPARWSLPQAASLGWESAGAASSPDVLLARDAANTLAQRNGANAQAFRVYNTFTDASNYERGRIEWVSNTLRIGTEAAGTGSNRTIEIREGSNTWLFSGGNLSTPGSVEVPSASQFRWASRVRISSPADALVRMTAATAANGAALELLEMTAPAAPAANEVRIYAEDNGSGKTQLMALFATGAAQQIAIEP